MQKASIPHEKTAGIFVEPTLKMVDEGKSDERSWIGSRIAGLDNEYVYKISCFILVYVLSVVHSVSDLTKGCDFIRKEVE